MEKKLEYTVTREDVPGNINDILKKRLGLSGHQISSAKYRRGGISRNGSRARVSEAVSPGDGSRCFWRRPGLSQNDWRQSPDRWKSSMRIRIWLW